jgi:hypothetical protein
MRYNTKRHCPRNPKREVAIRVVFLRFDDRVMALQSWVTAHVGGEVAVLG